MSFKSINPYTEEVLGEFPVQQDKELLSKISLAEKAFTHWKDTHISQRAELFRTLGRHLLAHRDSFARTITMEMGKPIEQAKAEVEKCAWLCDYYAESGEEFLLPEEMPSDAIRSYVRFDPLGGILGIMPWNYPFWQVFRYAVPTLMAGNVTLLKHAPNVPQVADQLEQLFLESGFHEGIFQSLYMYVSDVPDLIAHPFIQGVTLTGSNKAGASVAAIAGKHIKKTVLELGGSDAFIVLSDADLSKAAQIAVKARMQNTGQSCIAAKRFIVEEAILDEFTELVLQEIEQLQLGDPLLPSTTLGPMARQDLAQQLERQMQATQGQGGQLLTGGQFEGCKVKPILMSNINADMTAFQEETFGPLAAIVPAKDEKEVLRLANDSKYGLGASIWTQDLEHAQRLAASIDAGCVFINDMVKSDPRLPFGGIKQSGYGRELAKYGIREFVNAKTVWLA